MVFITSLPAKKQRQQDQEDEVSGEESDDEGSEGDQMETIEEDVEVSCVVSNSIVKKKSLGKCKLWPS